MARSINRAFPCFGLWQSPAAPVGLLFLLLIGFLLSDWRLQVERDQRTRELVAPPAGLVHFHFGFREAMADSFWVRSLQDFDFCEKQLATHYCQGKGWLFQTLDLITNLDPNFRMAYSAGGMALTILVSDYAGASILFDRGIEHFPNDWVLLYKAAYHALQEEKNVEKAAGLMERAAKNGAPDWVYVLAGRLHTDAGRRELAQHVLEEMQALGMSEKMLDRLRQKIQEGDAGQPH